MSAYESDLAARFVQALGWTLVHFVWQGAAVALLVASLKGLLRERAASLRYVAGCAALALMATLPAATFGHLWVRGPAGTAPGATAGTWQSAGSPRAALAAGPAAALPASGTAVDGADAVPGTSSWRAQLEAGLRPALPWLVALWLAGVVLLSLRLAGGWLVARRLRSVWTRPLGADWERRLERLRQRLAIARPVLLLESARVQVPTVIGWLRPAILLPLSALGGLSVEQLEAIVAHELAHIRRHDFLVNLLQSLVETLLFYHPAVWWVSDWMRVEREHCCDDLAVAVCGDALGYAHALTDLESWRVEAPRLAVAASGGVLLERIRRLLGVREPEENATARPLAALLLLGLLAASIGAGALVLHSRPAEAGAAGQPADPKHAMAMPSSWMEPDAELDDGTFWCKVQREEQYWVLVFGQHQPLGITGTGKLRINAKSRMLLLPGDHALSVEGKPVEDKTKLLAGQSLSSRGPDGDSFWTVRAAAAAAAAREPNIVGELSLELEYPTAVTLEFLPPYGAAFQSRPIPARVVLGVLLEPIGEPLALQHGLQPGSAFVLTHVPDTMPAGRAGLRPGDIIATLPGGVPATPRRVQRALVLAEPGQTLALGVLRDGRTVEARVVLESREAHQAALSALERQVTEQNRRKPQQQP